MAVLTTRRNGLCGESDLSQRIPLFPLQLVLFPGGVLPLRIFETRYLDMVRRCAADDEGFGICLLLPEDEHNDTQALATIGTMAKIADFSTRDDGLLGITVTGQDRFVIQQTSVQHDGLIIGEVDWLECQAGQPVPPDCSALVDVLREINKQLRSQTQRELRPETDYDDAECVGFRLAELLPISVNDRQLLLEMQDPIERLRRLLHSMSNQQETGPE